MYNCKIKPGVIKLFKNVTMGPKCIHSGHWDKEDFVTKNRIWSGPRVTYEINFRV